MVKKTILDEIKDALTKKKIVIGTSLTVKKMKTGKVGKVFVSNNCPKNVLVDIERYSKAGSIDVEVLEKSNEELGVLCKKPFSISVLSILGDKKK